MINHTMFVQFTEPIPDADLDQYLADVEKATKNTGSLLTFAAQRHLRVPGEEQIPGFIATVVIQLGVTDLEALGALFVSPEVEAVFDTWRTRYPYKAAWANHETLA
ncbi:hypothetical protein [Streptomyces rhizosphaericus]|uniref:Uncharacterized protein n=1 Tax=Streptomyces rhizosphaericus TaxID=114699 RepID=A0A6G4AVL9_9ACTN|nr:hypothetical protein [Streptomyces rhizosphaericus]NEW76517.1 hypothetical protein [Streptomyces rhizosphaericus]